MSADCLMRSLKAVPMPWPALELVRNRIGMLRNHRSHQEPAIASALDREFFRARVLLFDQIFCSGREIIEDVLFFGEIAGLVPLLTEFSAASNVCHHVHATAIEPEPSRKIEIRRHADAVAAIAV